MMWRRNLILVLVFAALAVFVVQPAAAQTNPTWNAEYYNNGSLTGPAVRTRLEPAISFNWGRGAPEGVTNVDGFSARYGTDVYLPAGTYRFSARADDHVRVIVDYQFQPLIDTFDKGLVGQTITADISLTEGMHHIQVDFREVGGDAFVFVSFANAGAPGPVVVNPPPVQPVTSGPWLAQYFPNRDLASSPTLIQSENSPTHDWGAGSPAASIPADYWSARWTSIQNLNAGNYRFTARADDGVRVYVDGRAVINEWHSASGLTYTADVTLSAGQHSFMVEFQELSGAAFLQYSFDVATNTPVQPPPAQQPLPTTGVLATVNVGMLNVRGEPSAYTGRIVAIINRSQTFPVIGSNPDRSWVQLDLGSGRSGWVNALYVTLSGGGSAPVVNPPVNGATGYTVKATPFTVNIRSGPNVTNTDIGNLPANVSARVIGRTSTNSWWQIEYNGVRGWVSGQYTQLQSGANVSQIPVTG